MRNDIDVYAKLLAFIQKKTDEEENTLIQRWLEESEENVNLFLRLKKIYEEEDEIAYIPESELQAEWQRVEAEIHPKGRKLNIKTYRGIAATALVLLGIWGIWGVFKHSTPTDSSLEKMYHTNAGERKSFTLPDGTLVWLNASSSLWISGNYNQADRKVRLAGEAWFDVAKNREKPFSVNAEEILITVLGTQFNLSAYEWDQGIVASLDEGVITYSDGQGADLILRPGDQVEYLKKDKSSTLQRFPDNRHNAWKHNKLILKDCPLSLSIKRIEDFYGIELSASKPIDGQDLISMTIDGDSPQEVIELLNTITDNHFTMKNNSP